MIEQIPDTALLAVPLVVFLGLNAKTGLDWVGSLVATAVLTFFLMSAGFFAGVSLWGVLT